MASTAHVLHVQYVVCTDVRMYGRFSVTARNSAVNDRSEARLEGLRTCACLCLPANDKLIKETQLVWIKYTRSRAECYTHDT
jgi:N6-adenosine-specific RNA methylase IME4